MTNIYKPPKADLLVNEVAEIKPFRAILVGLVMVVIVLSIVSSVLVIVFTFNNGSGLTSEELTLALAESPAYLAVDLLISVGVLILSGYVVAKYVPSQELKYGLIMGIITLIFYISAFVLSDAFSTYPLWYCVLSLLLMVPALVFGAKCRVNT